LSKDSLSETGYVESQSVWSSITGWRAEYDRVPALVAELVRRGVAVIRG
jgi:hypothetical protein